MSWYNKAFEKYAYSWQLGPFVRPVDKPVISPRSHTSFKNPMTERQIQWENSSTFNPAAVVYKDKICLLYRAEDDSDSGIGERTSRIGLAWSDNGILFERHDDPDHHYAVQLAASAVDHLAGGTAGRHRRHGGAAGDQPAIRLHVAAGLSQPHGHADQERHCAD